MDDTKIEGIIQDCKDMALDTTFNLDYKTGEFSKTINYERYANLLEGLLRKFLSSVDQHD